MIIVPGLWATLILMIAAVVAYLVFAVRRGWFEWDRCHLESITGSHLVSKRTLLIFRVLSTLFIFSTLLAGCIDGGKRAVMFYTVWNYTILAGFFLGLAVHSLVCHFSPAYYHAAWDSGRWTVFHARVTWVLFQLCVTTCLLVDVTVWTVLYPAAKRNGNSAQLVNFESFCMHLFNVFFILAELLLNKMPFVWSHALWPVLLATIYGLFQWVLHAGGASWAYFFLDTSKNVAPAWYLGLWFAHVLLFFTGYGLYALKMKALGSRAADSQRVGEKSPLIIAGSVVNGSTLA